ncbi:zinc finger CCCH domain-containing protein 43 [Phtheirospermum japonicum]|uniref:Zinc finger CCCH domain-containing protein 43 n=1 Tax=Phtheirospermum japonicum TaxID=374723 RepID=A0A830BFS7_9LAMI|nr:zinc finger CCCH domain-containing protein 43 [Phtheirospermum japonicum]
MAELLPSSTSEKPQIEKLGLGLADTTSHDQINLSCSNSEIQHTEPSRNAPDGKSDSLMAVEVEDIGPTHEEAEFQIVLERDFCRLTIEQAEIESARERSEAVDVEEGKNVEGTVKLGDVHEEKNGKNAESVEDENQNGLGDVENEGTVKLDNLHEEKDGKIAKSVENENENRRGYMENEEPVKLDNLHEEKEGEKNIESVEHENENRWGYMENEETMKPDYVYEEKGGKYIESVENDNRWGYIENEKPVKLDNVYDDKGGKSVESVEDENENGLGYMENAGGAATRFGRYNNQSNNNKRISYPMRPDAEDCAFYMRSGSCKFGSNCKFNHPPRRKNQGVKERSNFNEENSERAGQTECKGEKECPYYMRTGTCKYGISCRFHHPEPTTVGGADSPSGYGNDGSIPSQLVSSSSISSWSSPRAFNETSPFTPVIFSQTQGAPTSDSDWNSYQDQPICTHYHRYGICKYGPACKYDHPSNYANLPTPSDGPPFSNLKVFGGES